jgi:hypothetical protein
LDKTWIGVASSRLGGLIRVREDLAVEVKRDRLVGQ